MTKTSVNLKIDWNNDGDFTDTGETINDRLISLAWERGRDFHSSLIPCCKSGKLVAVVNNNSGDYSPNNASSPIAGNILPGRRVDLQYTPPPGGFFVRNSGDTNDVKIDCGSDSTIDNVFTGGGSVEFWFRVHGEGNSSTQGVWNKGAAVSYVTSISGRTFKLSFLHVFSGDNGVWITADPLDMGNWYHVAITYDKGSASNDPIVYVNGASVSIDESTTPTGTADSDAADVLELMIRGASNTVLNGDVADFRYWSDIRSASEIADNYEDQLVGNEAGLVAYLKLDEGTETTASDSTVNGNDGTIDSGITWETPSLWSGYLDLVVPSGDGLGRKTATLTAFGPISRIAAERINIAMDTNVLTGTAVGDVLDAAGWSSTLRDLDAGQTTMKRFFMFDSTVLRALRVLEATETGFLIESKDGKIVFEDRHHRLVAPHTTALAVFSDAIPSDLTFSRPRDSSPYTYIRNVWEVDVPVFVVGSLAVLWTLAESGSESPALAPGESRTFSAVYPTPDAVAEAIGVDAWTTPVSTTDYTANSVSDGSGTDLTASIGVVVVKTSNAMKITLTNNAAVTAFVTLLQARGTPVTMADPIRIRDEDSASQTAFGRKAFNLGLNFIPTSLEAIDWAAYGLSVFKAPFQFLTLTFTPTRSETSRQFAILLDISDRLTLTANSAGGSLGVNGDYFVESERHTIDGEEKIHRVEYTLTSVGQQPAWILGTSELGTDTVLAY